MRITAVARRVGTTTDQIRYLERKKYVKGRWRRLKNRRVRDYGETEIRKAELIIKYLNQGFKHDFAYLKAMEEIRQPRLT